MIFRGDEINFSSPVFIWDLKMYVNRKRKVVIHVVEIVVNRCIGKIRKFIMKISKKCTKEISMEKCYISDMKFCFRKELNGDRRRK